MASNHIDFRTDGFTQLEHVIDELGQVPRKVARAAARAGGAVELKAARAYAPVGYGDQHSIERYTIMKNGKKVKKAQLKANGTIGETGILRRGIVNMEENSGASDSGKAAFDIRMDKAMTDIFVKTTEDGKRYFYPASMEYGFAAPGKGGSGQKVFDGTNFLKNAADVYSEAIHKAMEDKAIAAIDKILNSG